MPFDLSDYFKFGVQVNELPIASGIFTSMAKVKLFIAPEQITITVDCGYGCKGPGNHTKIISFDRQTGKIRSYFDSKTDKLYFVSYFVDEKLFRFLPRGKDWEIQIIDGKTGIQLATHTLLKNEVAADELAFKNDGKNFRVSKNVSLRSVMFESISGAPVLTVSHSHDDGYLIRWGTFKEIPGVGQYLLAGASLPTSVYAFQMMDKWIVTPGIVYYSYLHFDPLTSQFRPASSNPGISGKIEDYEIILANENVTYVSYALFNDGIIGIYLLKKKAAHEIRLVQFQGSDYENR